MEEHKNPRRDIRVTLQPSPRMLKIAVILLIVFSTMALVGLSWVQSGIRNQIEDMRQEAAALEQENAGLSEKIADAGSLQGAENIAREELGLINPDTVVINPNSSD